MKIRVGFTVDLDSDQVNELLDWGACLGHDVDRPVRAVLAELLAEHGTAALPQAREHGWSQVVELAELEGGYAW